MLFSVALLIAALAIGWIASLGTYHALRLADAERKTWEAKNGPLIRVY